MFADVSKIEMRVALASIGLLFASIAWLTAVMTGAELGHCLPDLRAGAVHCPACYAAVAFLIAAVAPWPGRRVLKAR